MIPVVIIRVNIFALQLDKVLIVNMTPGVFNLKYLSFYWFKIKKWGQFWKPEVL